MKKEKPVFIDAFVHEGSTIQIREWTYRDGTKGYAACYSGSDEGQGELAPFFSVEECRAAIKKLLTGQRAAREAWRRG